MYATTVPRSSTNSFSNYIAYLYVPCTSKQDYDIDATFGQFKYIECLTDEGDSEGGESGNDPESPETPDDPDDDTTVSVEEVSAVMIYAKEGTVYSEVDFEIYDLAGVNVTKLNGSLQGIYIMKTAEGNRLVSVW